MQTILVQYPWLAAGACAAFGLCVGSFLNVVVHRLPRMLERRWTGVGGEREPRNLLTPPSSCPRCGARLRVRDNVPLLSYLLLRGRCAHCGAGIAFRYPLVEVLAAALTVWAAFASETALQLLGALLFGYALLSLFFIDLERQLLPDAITLPLLWTGLLFNTAGAFSDLESAVLGAVAGYLALWLVYHAFRLLTGKEGLGYGDFKLVAAVGAWLGWQMLPLVILLGSVAGAVAGGLYLALSGHGRDRPIPFGPFLAAAAWVSMSWGDDVVDYYFALVGIG